MSQRAATGGSPPPPKTHAHAVARWCIRPLVGTRVTPNHLTTLRLLTGLAAAAAFASGESAWVFWGGVLFAVSALLDRADGELARLGGGSSTGGHWYDLYADMTVNVMTFVGIGIGVAGAVPGIWGPVMGVVAGASIGATFLIVFRMHDQGSHPSAVFDYPTGFDLDDALFLVVPFALLDWLLPLLAAAVVGAPAFLAFALYRWSRARRRPS